MSGNLGANLINQLQSTPMASPDYWTHQMQNMNALQDYQAKQATADAYRQSVDANGNFDQAGFNARVASGAGAWNAGPTMQAASTLQDTQTRQQLLRVGWYNGAAGALPDDASRDQVIKTIQSGAAVGMSPTEIQSEIGRVPTDPAQLQSYIQQHRLTAASAADQLQRQYGTRPEVHAGGTVQFPNVPAPGKPAGPGQTTSVQMTPSIPAQGTTVTILHPDSTTEQVLPDQVDSVLRNKPGSSVVQPGTGGGGGAANNPLNMRFVGQPGATNSGGFAAFSTPEAGQAATDALFRSYAAGGINTLTGLISKWAPPNENNTPAYIASVAKATGLDPNAPIDLTNPAIATKIQQAMAAVEGNKNARVMPPQGPQAGQQTPPATTPAQTTPPPPAATPAAPASPFGASAFAQPSTALPAPPSQATAPNTTAAVPAVPTPQKAAAMAIAQRTGRPAPIAGTDGLFVDKNGNVGSGPNAGGLGRRADIPNALLAGVQTAQTTMPPANVLTAGPGAPTTGLPSGAAPTVPPANAFGTGAFGSAPAAAPVTPPPPVVQPPAQAVPPQAQRGAGWSAPPGYVSGIETRQRADIDAYTKDSGAVSAHQNNVNTLQNAYHALQLADTGPGTQNLQAARAFLQSFGIATSATGDQATQWAEAHKYLMDFARTQGGLGGTDLQAQLAQGSNASTDIPKPAALAVVRNNIAKERLAMAQVQEANGSGGYVDHTKNFAPAQDLRAFQADIMPPQELKQIEALQKTNPQAFAKFQKSLDIARAHGLISDEDLAAQNQRIRALGP